MAFHGGMLGTILAMWLFARRHNVTPLTVMDVVAASVPFGLFFGRIANFINAEVCRARERRALGDGLSRLGASAAASEPALRGRSGRRPSSSFCAG